MAAQILGKIRCRLCRNPQRPHRAPESAGIIPADFTAYPGAPETLTQSPASANFGTAAARYITAVNGVRQTYADYGKGSVNKRWNSLSPLEKKAQARYMEIYAGMVDNLDHNVGRLMQHLKDIGAYENTVIIFQSDSGAESGATLPGGGSQTATDEANAVEPAYATLGTDNGKQGAYNLKYGARWAEVSATPFNQTKSYAGEGGVATPLIVYLPGHTAQLPPLHALTHVTDNTATFLALAGVSAPTTPAPVDADPHTGANRNQGKLLYQGRAVWPVTGVSLLPLLDGASGVNGIRAAPLGHESYGRAALTSVDRHWKVL